MEIGKLNQVTVDRMTKEGAILKRDTDSVFLNRKGFPKVMKEGMTLEVFIYNDGKEGIAATIEKPHAQLDEFAVLTVQEVTSFGAFLDWGIFKDLFLPKRNFDFVPKKGERIAVKVVLDYEQKGLIADARMSQCLKKPGSEVELRDKVDCLIYKKTPIGYQCIVNNAYQGMIYQDETFDTLMPGMHRKGFIKKIREDGKLDISMQQPGFQGGKSEEKERILAALEKGSGHLYLNDKSDAQEIRNQLKMSKRNFKAVVGMLMREGKVLQDDKGIHLA